MATDTPDVQEDRGVAVTKVRGVRIDDELWSRAQAKAKGRRETVAAVIKRALVEYVGDEDEDETE